MPKPYGTPGPRALYPSMATSQSIAACDPMAQLLFDRLIEQADDQGRQQGDASLVKAACMPLIKGVTEKRIEAWLAQLAQHQLILRYQTGGYSLIQLVTWWRWQSGMRWAYPSRWPAPEGWSDTVRIPPTKGRAPDGGPSHADGTSPQDAETFGETPQTSEEFGVLPAHAGAGAGAYAGAGAGAGAEPATPPPDPPRSSTDPPPTNGHSADDDHLDAWYRLTGSWPTPKVLPWLNELAEAHGPPAVCRALAAECLANPERSTLLSRTQDRLRRSAHEAAKAAEIRRRREEAEEQARIEAMPAEVRAANMARLGEMMTAAGLRPVGRRGGRPQRLGELLDGGDRDAAPH